MKSEDRIQVTLIGAGTIGLSFAALHLNHRPNVDVTIHDTRPNLEAYIYENLSASSPTPLTKEAIDTLFATRRLRIASTLQSAVQHAHIVQEQGPENTPFKQSIWPDVEALAPPECLFWSSTSGIAASIQSARMTSKSRLLVVHPYNPPHVMPILEIVPSPSTAPGVVDGTLDYWKASDRVCVVVRKEVTGFVANRLAFALLREALHLVNEGVVSPEDVDRIVENSMGPRWAVAGPFKSYHAGGGAGGLRAFFGNIGGTIQGCWDDNGKVNMGGGWESRVCEQVESSYGAVNPDELRDRGELTKKLITLRNGFGTQD